MKLNILGKKLSIFISCAFFTFACSSTPEQAPEDELEATGLLDDESSEQLDVAQSEAEEGVENEYNDAFSQEEVASDVSDAEESLEEAASILEGGEAQEVEEIADVPEDVSYTLDSVGVAEVDSEEDLEDLNQNKIEEEVVDTSLVSSEAEEAMGDYQESEESDMQGHFSGELYVVQPGDNLAKISRVVYGTANRWRELASDNNIDGSRIFPGDALKVRESDSNEGYRTAVSSLMKHSVVVQRGDTLASIAKKVFGSTNYWKVLHQYNKSKVSNPNQIYAGQELTYYKKSDIQAAFTSLTKSELGFAH